MLRLGMILWFCGTQPSGDFCWHREFHCLLPGVCLHVNPGWDNVNSDGFGA